MPRSPRRAEIYRLKKDPVGKKRPVLVVSRNELNGGHYLLAIPFYSAQTAEKSRHPTAIPFAQGEFGLEKDCVAKADEVTQYRMSDLTLAEGPLGTVDPARMAAVDKAIAYVFNL